MSKAARRSAGYREYSESAIDRVRLVQNALRFGFSLKQVRAFLVVRHACGAPCKKVRAAGAQILEAIERQITELTVSRESVKETLKLWDQRLAQTPEGQRARCSRPHLPPKGYRLVGRRSGRLTESPNPDRQD